MAFWCKDLKLSIMNSYFYELLNLTYNQHICLVRSDHLDQTVLDYSNIKCWTHSYFQQQQSKHRWNLFLEKSCRNLLDAEHSAPARVISAHISVFGFIQKKNPKQNRRESLLHEIPVSFVSVHQPEGNEQSPDLLQGQGTVWGNNQKAFAPSLH